MFDTFDFTDPFADLGADDAAPTLPETLAELPPFFESPPAGESKNGLAFDDPLPC